MQSNRFPFTFKFALGSLEVGEDERCWGINKHQIMYK